MSASVTSSSKAPFICEKHQAASPLPETKRMISVIKDASITSQTILKKAPKVLFFLLLSSLHIDCIGLRKGNALNNL